MRWLAQILATASLVVAGIKWLRVAQREHYLGGSVLAIAGLWVRTSPLNAALLGISGLAALGAVTVADPAVATIVAAVATGIFPFGLGLRGRTSPLVWTARLRRVAAILVLLVVVAALGVGALVSGADHPVLIPHAIVVVGLISLVDLAVRVAAPLERRLSQRFVDQAVANLRRVAPIVVGITGSYGKTSTKGYVQNLVQGSLRVVASPASFNNRMGLSRAVNEQLTGDAEVFVAEMGTYGPGEIADLCAWIPPAIAVMTAIGPVHLERFGSEAKIVEAKSEILEPASVAVFNVDHPALAALADRADATKKVWRCGSGEGATDVRVVSADGSVDVMLAGRSIGRASSSVFAGNLACAIAVALELGVAERTVLQRIEGVEAPAHRQTVSLGEAGFTIIDDTFNANPAGAARALKTLRAEGGPQARRVVVTPGMVELGPRQAEENAKFAEAAAAVADEMVIVGTTNRAALRRGAASGDASVIVVQTRNDAVAWARTHLGPGDVVLYENDLPDHYP